jgi:PAS domain S-box-containing protein
LTRALNVLRLAPIGFVAAIGLLSALGLAGAWAVAQSAPTLSVVLWMLPSVVVGALFTVYGTALLQGSIADSAVDFDRGALWRQGRILVAVFVIFTVTVSVVGILYVRDLRVTVRQQRFNQEQAIATLKARYLQRWIVDRSLDMQQRARSVANLLPSDGAMTSSARSLIEVLFAELLAETPEQVAVRLFTPDGKVLVQAGEPVEAGEGALVASSASRPDATAHVQQRYMAATGTLRLDFVTPIGVAPGRAARAVLVVAVDPLVSLFPELARWPTDSPSSEVMVVHKEQDHVTAVAIARARSDPRRRHSFALTQTDIVGVQAVLKGDGVREGLDYRGVPVLSASRHIEALDWHIVAKTDVSEALTPIEHRVDLVIWLTLGAIAVAAATSLGLWHADRTSYRYLRQRHEQERMALAHHYENMIKHARDIVMLVDEDRRLVEANDAALAAYGYSLEELRALHVVDLRTERDKPALASDWLEIHAGGLPVETVHRRKDGSEFPVEITGSSFDVGHRRYYQAFVRDISLRKRLEAEVLRLSRVQSALRTATGLLLRARDEDELYRGMCEALIEVGGYRLADVALANHDEGKSVRFAAIAGADQGYLRQTGITWGGGPRSGGPTGRAIRTGEVQINHDFASNAEMAPWREEALKRGLRSSIGLPLRAGDIVIGALTIYSGQPFAFTKDEVDFLVQFNTDLSYGVTLLRSRHA